MGQHLFRLRLRELVDFHLVGVVLQHPRLQIDLSLEMARYLLDFLLLADGCIRLRVARDLLVRQLLLQELVLGK